MRKYLNNLYQDTKIGHWIIYPFKKIYNFYQFRLLPEKTYIKRRFKRTFGYNLNLTNPKTLNEKIQWFQQNCRTPKHTICADKYAVRNYVADKIGNDHLIPLILHTTDVSEISPENLPDYPFIIKTNHGCGGHVIVKDKLKIDWISTQKYFKKLLKSNFYYKSREWQYKDIVPRIIVEKLLLDKNSNIPTQCKFYCFNGNIGFITKAYYKNSDIKVNIYDKDWNFINCKMDYDYCDEIHKPKMLNQLKSVAKILSKDFKYVRVDLYNINNNIYFAELTFSPSGGYQVYTPSKWDRIFGDKLEL